VLCDVTIRCYSLQAPLNASNASQPSRAASEVSPYTALHLYSLFLILLHVIQIRFLNLQAGGHRFGPGHVH
jgi:hypothetical protein